jgi:S-adenosylmethionine hydrolase
MIITLLSDFGTTDYFEGAMKGAVLSADPVAILVNITHEIPAHDITAGAFTLGAAYAAFPPNTIHLAVVDPGVGSPRRPIAVRANEYFFVGPDNGLFSFVYDREPDARVFHLTNRAYFREPVSNTFHGRDIFAPVAGALSRGVAIEELGPEIFDPVRLPWPRPHKGEEGEMTGAIIHIDRFGNCVINVQREDLAREADTRGFSVVIGEQTVGALNENYAEGAPAEPFAIWGSAGYLEVSVRAGSAAERLGLAVGDPVTIRLRGA